MVGVYQAFLIVKRVIQHFASGRMLYMKEVVHEIFRTGHRIGTGHKFSQLLIGKRLPSVRRLDQGAFV